MSGSPGRGAPSLDDALTADHLHLDGLFLKLRTAVGLRQSESQSAREEFERRLFRHMEWEEETLFPALRAADERYPERKIESLVIDHARIREKLKELAAGTRDRQWDRSSQAIEDLWAFLEGHNRDEEKGVYSDVDRLIPNEERSRLLDHWRSTAT